MGEFRMPSLGADMESGILVEWMVAPGDEVHRGQIIAAIETDKGVIDVEVFEDGVVSQILVEPGTKVPVGTALALIVGSADGTSKAQDHPAEPAPETARMNEPDHPRPPTKTPVARVVPPREPGSSPASETGETPVPRDLAGSSQGSEATAAPVRERDRSATQPSTSVVRASPRARKLAVERGIDLAAVEGSGPGGAVRAADLPAPEAQAAVKSTPAAESGSARRFDPNAMRAAIAAAMERSKREIPHYYLTHDVDLSVASAWLEAYNAERPPTERVLEAALMLRAVARAVRKHPSMNGFYRDGRFTPASGVHLGVAVTLRGGGLVTPALHDCDQRPLPELMAALTDLVKRARGGRLRGSEMTDGTLTVTSLGVAGVELVLPIIYPPQVACVGFGRIADRAVVVDGAVVVRPVATVSLGADHRVSDGHEGALFLRDIDKSLRHPEELL